MAGTRNQQKGAKAPFSLTFKSQAYIIYTCVGTHWVREEPLKLRVAGSNPVQRTINAQSWTRGL